MKIYEVDKETFYYLRKALAGMIFTRIDSEGRYLIKTYPKYIGK